MQRLRIKCVKCGFNNCLDLNEERDEFLACSKCKHVLAAVEVYEGWIYGLSNPGMLGLIKVGQTIRGVLERAEELASTGVPHNFETEFYFCSRDVYADEAAAHNALTKYRVRKDREFFKITSEDAISILQEKLGRPPDYVRQPKIVAPQPIQRDEASVDPGIKTPTPEPPSIPKPRRSTDDKPFRRLIY